jgi:LysR family transcriptional regulator for bpeEF and oprC
MLDMKALSVFVKVGERLSFVGAAKDLGMTQSGVSNAVSRLEDELGVRLLDRSTRNVNLTEEGALFLQRCQRILSELDDARLVLTHARLQPTGRLRISMPVSFGRLKVVPLLGAFCEQYPELQLVISFAQQHVNLIEDGVDVTIRVGSLKDSSLISRRLTETRMRVVGAPAYFAKHGRPKTLNDLSDHTCLAFISRETRTIKDWQFQEGNSEAIVTPKSNMSFDDGAALCTAVCAGFGISQMFDYFSDESISTGKLVPVLEEFTPSSTTISLVYPQARHLSPKVRAFADFVIARFR